MNALQAGNRTCFIYLYWYIRATRVRVSCHRKKWIKQNAVGLKIEKEIEKRRWHVNWCDSS